MRYFISLNDPVIRQLRQGGVLKGRRLLGRGSFCAVFESSHPNRIFKLMVDRGHYLYHTHERSPVGPLRPTLYRDFGQIGRTRRGLTIFMVEVEKLCKLPPRSPCRTLFGRIFKDVYRGAFVNELSLSAVCCTYPLSIVQFCKDALQFTTDLQLTINSFQGEGLMQREISGELVVSNLAYDPKRLHLF